MLKNKEIQFRVVGLYNDRITKRFRKRHKWVVIFVKNNILYFLPQYDLSGR